MTLIHSTFRHFPLIISLSVAAVALPAVPSGRAQTTAPAPTAQTTNPPKRQHFEPGRYIEGRIAFLKAVLKITPAQEASWDKVAAAMRENVREMQQMFERQQATRGHPQTAIERLKLRVEFAQLRVNQTRRFLDALQPLYANFSPDQKAIADDLLGRAHRRWHGWGDRW